MTTVIADISMTLDEFVTAAGADTEHGRGQGGEPIQGWEDASEHSPADAEILKTAFEETGAVVIGHNTYEFVDGPHGWEGDTGYAWKQDQSKAPTCFVVTHQPPQGKRLQDRFTFVTDGIESAIQQAQAAAGKRDVFIMGGANVIDKAIRAGLVDELRIHLSPVLIGSGTRLFDTLNGLPVQLEQARVVETPYATHLFYCLLRQA